MSTTTEMRILMERVEPTTERARPSRKKTRVDTALKGKGITHNRYARGAGGHTERTGSGYTPYAPDPITSGKYSPGTEWKALIAQSGTVTIYKEMMEDKADGEVEQWEIEMNGEIIASKLPTGTNVWNYLKTRFNTMIDTLVYVDSINKDVMRLDPHSPTMERAIENGSHDVKKDMGDINPTNALGFQEAVDQLEEQFKALIEEPLMEMEDCDCDEDCKCKGTCGGDCGDKDCPCECGSHTGKGKDESS